MKKKNLRFMKTLPLFALLAALSFVACQKSLSSTDTIGGSNLAVYLTDGPAQYDHVWIDIQAVEVKIDTDAVHMHDDHFGDNDVDSLNNHSCRDNFGKWDTLTIKAGIYDVLALRNGIDTLLASGSLPSGSIRKIRITLGNNNSVVLNGATFPLVFATGASHYLYAHVDKDRLEGQNTSQQSVWIDFDIFHSIQLIAGTYYLNGHLNGFPMHNAPRLEGKVLPAAAHPLITAFNATDTAFALPDADGEYRIKGMNAGTYKISFKPINGYVDTTISNIVITAGQETHVPTITLHK